jgi:hypothetical protein
MSWAGHTECTEDKRETYKCLIRKSEEKTLIEKLNYIWEDDIKMILK